MPSSSLPLSSLEAGVDIDAGDRLVENIKPYAKRTMRPEVLAGIGRAIGMDQAHRADVATPTAH